MRALILKLLFRLFPAPFRNEFGREIERVVARCGLAEAIADIVLSAVREHIALLGQDVRYALRGFRRDPGYAASAVLTVALGIGASTAMFTVVDRVLILVGEVWQDHIALDMEISGFESIPEILRAESRDDPMLVARVDTLALATKSEITICLPLSILEKFFSATGQRQVSNTTGSERERTRNRQLAESSLRSTQLLVSARMPDFQLSMRELASLREGSVVSTGIPCDTELRLLVSGRPRFRGVPGRVGRRLAVKVLGHLADGNPGELISQSEEDDV